MKLSRQRTSVRAVAPRPSSAPWLGLLIASIALAGPAMAQQGNKPWEEYGKLLETRRSVAALDADSMFGEGLDLYSGSLTFSMTDVSLKGNSGLPVEFRRKYEVIDREKQAPSSAPLLGDWQVDLPHVGGIFSSTAGWHAGRCNQPVPPTVTSPSSPEGTTAVAADEYWSGNHASMPGGGEMLSLASGAASWPKPPGDAWKWVTAGNVYFLCTLLPGSGGEGFMALTPDGTEYWFTHPATMAEKPLGFRIGGASGSLGRVRVSLYVTLVKDRFQNTVTYTYSNQPNEPIRPTRIASRLANTSQDDRTIDIDYSPDGRINKVRADGLGWDYHYTGTSLTSVHLPDGQSVWQIGLAGLAAAKVDYSVGDSRKCQSLDPINEATTFSGWLVHPSGARADYLVGARRFGRSSVPLVCRNYQRSGVADSSGTNDDYPVAPIRAWQLTLLSRAITGPGLPPANWTYDWSPGAGTWALPPGHSEPVCADTTCLDPLCTGPACAGSRSVRINGPGNLWTRYEHGNTYRYDEGLLRSISSGEGGSTLRTVTHAYDLANVGQRHASRYGVSRQGRGAGWISEAVRPRVATITEQDGAEFRWLVDQGCEQAGAYCLDMFVKPTQVTRQSTVAPLQSGATLSLPPSTAPVVSSPADSTNGSYVVSWSAIAGSTSYELQSRQGSQGWTALTSGGATSHPVNGQQNGNWSYRVRACNAAGCSSFSGASTTRVFLVPTSAPTVQLPATSSGDYTLSWSQVGGATHYEIQQSLGSGGFWYDYATSTGLGIGVSSQVGTYGFKVRGCSAHDCGPFSAPAFVQVSTVIPVPTGLAVSPSTTALGNTVLVTWNAVPGATSYKLEIVRPNGVVEEPTVGQQSYQLTANRLGNWVIKVRAINGSQQSAWSNSVGLMVQGTP